MELTVFFIGILQWNLRTKFFSLQTLMVYTNRTNLSVYILIKITEEENKLQLGWNWELLMKTIHVKNQMSSSYVNM
jgi:hypothetical protein